LPVSTHHLQALEAEALTAWPAASVRSAAVRRSTPTETTVDDKVDRIIEALQRRGVFD
jgi:hypothetical protein